MSCVVKECEDKVLAHSMCSKHYQRWKKHGDPEVVLTPGGHPPNRKCEVPGCQKGHFARGICHMHYTRCCRQGVKEPTVHTVRELEIAEARRICERWGVSV